MAGTRFSALTDFRPEKNRFLDRAKTVYLKATHKTEDITFYWIEQRGDRGRNAYHCACQLPDKLLVFLAPDKEACAAIDEFWKTMTREELEANYTVENMVHETFSEEYRALKDQYIHRDDAKESDEQ